MKYLYGILLFGFLLPPGCSHNHKEYSPLEGVLRLAGSNRRQLERVIKHYSATPADSLKLKAAEFLILNMPGKYSEGYTAPWEDVATVNLRWSSSSDKSRVLDIYKLGEPAQKADLHHITADYLISNIDLAFQVWNDKPWGKYISFDTFCEEILPYRIGAEPLINWREKVLASFADINNSLKEDSTITAVDACRKVNALLPRFRLDKDFADMSYTQLMATTRGMCDSQAALATFVMRALGIPVTIDFTPNWKSSPSGHNWNSVCDSTGQHISFMGTETDPYVPHQGNTLLKGKAYRQIFGYHRIADADDQFVPPLFRGNNIVDISAEHENMADVTVPVKRQSDTLAGYPFLALFYDYAWRVIGHGTPDTDSARFDRIGKDILYLPVYYANGNQTAAGVPFYVDKEGKAHLLPPDSPDSLMSFRSITPEDDLRLNWRMENAVFEVSDSADFSNAREIYRILEKPKLYNKVTLKKRYSCRYVRYKAPYGSYCNVSEIVFYDASGRKLEGENICLPGSYEDRGDTGDKAFDGDITTFYDATGPEESWTGLDFGEEKEIASIQYSPRLLGIGIYEGHRYELFQWGDDGWTSLGKKTATGEAIEFKVPRRSLFYLSNNTINKKGHISFILGNSLFYYN